MLLILRCLLALSFIAKTLMEIIKKNSLVAGYFIGALLFGLVLWALDSEIK